MNISRKISIGSDHAGFELKKAIIEHLEGEGVEVLDIGTYSADSVDYPDFAHGLAGKVESRITPFGVLICGSANGVAMAANKHAGIRAAIAWSESVAKLARQHNDANVICLPARFIDTALALKCVDIFLTTDFEEGRHARRVDKISIG